MFAGSSALSLGGERVRCGEHLAREARSGDRNRQNQACCDELEAGCLGVLSAL